jgi:hypothetical protein
MRSRGDNFKPIQPEFSVTAKAACDYTKWPEVKAHSDRSRPADPRLARQSNFGPSTPSST